MEKAIEEFQNKRLGVYKTDPDDIVRNTRVAERATKDHIGRWLFELLQNSDDAEASEVRIIVGESTIYVADNGHGLKPAAVSAICGTDFSDKSAGTIGRKGVGFKSVYEVSTNPQVLNVDGGGIEFSLEKTRMWLLENDLNDGHVPYQWIPFYISWTNAQQVDPQLRDLTTYKTVVKLPGISLEKKQKVEQLLKEWPPHALFAFRHLRRITAPCLEVELTSGDGVWSLHDNRGKTPSEWRVVSHTEWPPDGCLDLLGTDERNAVCSDGVSFLIAAPREDECVVPTSDYLPVHVFYPTEQKGPVRLLLHAEFLVKSDRTALIPVDSNPFNAWVADRLAHHVCKFVNDSYCPEVPSSHAALLVPFSDRASHPVAENIWRRIVDEAMKCLRLADIEGYQRLSLAEAQLVSVKVRPDLVRILLEATSVRGQLLHPAFDIDKEAHKALRELGCKEIHDQDLLATIARNADLLAVNTQWVWTCWQWLADWVAEKPYGEEHEKRIERARSLPVVPVYGSLVKISDVAGRIVTWRSDAGVDSLPDWLPLIFVEDWFRDRIQNEAKQDSPVKKLSKELGIVEPGVDVIHRAVGHAIEVYWKDKQGDPERFLRFILEQDWHETVDVLHSVRRCPVPLSQPVRGEQWAEAGNAYFGREWGNDLLANLYDDITAVAWVARNDTATVDDTKRRHVLEWLGVAHCPRILEESKDTSVWWLPDECSQWRQYLCTADNYDRPVDRIATVSQVDYLAIDSLDAAHGMLLIRRIVPNWKIYYRNRAKVDGQRHLGRGRYRSSQVNAKWWWEICERLPVPKRDESEGHTALTKLWLPDKRTEKAIGSLLPVIDIDAFGIDDKDAVREWLISTVRLRTQIEQVTVEEWKALLSTRISDEAPVERLVLEERLRDKVTGWYAACLENVAEQENVSERAFASCPLLCRKGDVWQYVTDELRYLDDDNDLSRAFAEDVWLFHIPRGLYAVAVNYLGVLRLSQSVEVNVTPGEPQLPLSGELSVRFCESLPYVWALRSSNSKQAAEGLSRLKGLGVLVVPALRASLSLDSLHHEVERRWHITDRTIYLHKDHENEVGLAQALAKALDATSEADSYENLLRCTDDRQRKEKLLSKGIADAEIDRCLREYSESPAEEEHDEGLGKLGKDEQGGRISQAPSPGRSEGPQREQPPAAQPGETSENTSPEPPESGKQPLGLRDPSTAPYVVGSPPSGGAGTGGSGEDGGTTREGRSLTDAEKVELEEAGRDFAVRDLENMGYSVEKMPLNNPGFDLRAKKDGNELRVEVKAHVGRATVVDVTQRQYKEYLGQQGYRWELWNVEHLAEGDFDSVTITQYNQIPDDALDARTFRVDLKKCQRKLQD